jgi:hypothetical protein
MINTQFSHVHVCMHTKSHFYHYYLNDKMLRNIPIMEIYVCVICIYIYASMCIICVCMCVYIYTRIHTNTHTNSVDIRIQSSLRHACLYIYAFVYECAAIIYAVFQYFGPF